MSAHIDLLESHAVYVPHNRLIIFLHKDDIKRYLEEGYIVKRKNKLSFTLMLGYYNWVKYVEGLGKSRFLYRKRKGGCLYMYPSGKKAPLHVVRTFIRFLQENS